MIVSIGKEIDLTLFLTKNHQIWSGAAVTVQVVKQSDGTEELASTALSETSPGTYSFLWSTAPEVIVNLVAKYFVDNVFYSGEPIEIISGFGGSGAGSLQLLGLIEDTLDLEGIVNDVTDVQGLIDESLQLDGIIDDTLELGGLIEENETVTAIVQD